MIIKRIKKRIYMKNNLNGQYEASVQKIEKEKVI